MGHPSGRPNLENRWKAIKRQRLRSAKRSKAGKENEALDPLQGVVAASPATPLGTGLAGSNREAPLFFAQRRRPVREETILHLCARRGQRLIRLETSGLNVTCSHRTCEPVLIGCLQEMTVTVVVAEGRSICSELVFSLLA